MSTEQKKISAKEVVSDIQAGATDLNREASGAENNVNDETDKYKQLFTMAEAAFNNEESRYDRIEDTGHKYIPIVLYLVSAEAFFANWVFKNLFPLKDVLDYLGFLSILLAFLTLFVGIILLVWSFSFEDLSLLRPNQEVVSFFDKYELARIYRAYAVKYIKQLDYNTDITNKKINIRRWAYRFMMGSFVLLILTGVFYAVHLISTQIASSDELWNFWLLNGDL